MKTLAQVLAEERKRQDEREEAAVRRMTGLYQNLDAEIATRLRVLDATIAEAIANGDEVKPSWLHQQARYRVLQEDVNALVDLYATEGDRAIRDARMAEIRAGRWDAAERTAARTPDVNMGSVGVNHQAVENMAAQLSRESPVHTVLADMAGQYTEAIEQSLISGVANGRGVDAILRDVMQATAGVMSPQRVRTIIRTESMRAYNTALVEQYDEIPEVAAFEWSTARSSRTCVACLGMDGERFTRKEDIPGRHTNCRCTISPVPENEYQSVKDYFARRGTAEEWMRKRSPADIRRHFPSEDAYQAFMRGDLTLKDFVGESHSRVWGSSIRQKSGREALEGLNRAPKVASSPTVPANGFASQDDAVAWFGKHNIQVVTGKDTGTWEMSEVARGFEREIQAGAPVPPRVEFYKGRANDPSAAGYQFNRKAPGEGYIMVNTTQFNRISLDEMAIANAAEDTRWIVGTDPLSLITHEIGHYRHFSRADAYTHGALILDDGRRIPMKYGSKKKQKELAGEMSQYAAESPLEFVAETYTALRNGEDVPAHLLELFDEFGGVRP